MAETSIAFKEKIEYILEHMASGDYKILTSFFWIEDNTSLENRQMHIKNYWLNDKKQNFSPRKFVKEYSQYKFSTFNIDGKAIFENAQEFLEIDLESFKRRIQHYIQSQIKGEVQSKAYYKYFYVYNKNASIGSHKIDYYTIEYKRLLTPNSFAIKVLAPKYKQEMFRVTPYEGEIIFLNQKVIVLFKNQYDYVAAIFNMELSNSYTPFLVGVGLGISDLNQKTPIAKKVILSKTLLDDYNELYLTLNETETILAQENLYSLSFSLEHDKSYLNQISHKINNLNEFLQNSSQNYFKKIEYKVAFREFNAISKVMKKVASGSTFYIKSRERVLESVLDSYEYKPYKELYIVMPILNKYNVFRYYSPTAKELISKLKKLSKKVKINFICCLLESCSEEFPVEIEDFFDTLKDSVNFHILYFDKVATEVNSYDFIFTDNKDFVFAKLIRSRIPAFRFFNDSTTLDDYESYFYKICKYSLSLDEYRKDKSNLCKISLSPLAKKFIGVWNLYILGSKKFWHDKLKIYEDNTVELYSEGVITDTGYIIHKTRQSLIILEDKITQSLLTMQFDNNGYNIEKGFLVNVIGKQYMTDKDIFSVGLCVKDEISLKEAREILQIDNGKVLYLDNGAIKEKLKDFLTNKYGFYSTQ